jgi:hypothetical protein
MIITQSTFKLGLCASFLHDKPLFKWFTSLGVALSTDHYEMRPEEKSRYSLHIVETYYHINMGI